MNIVEINKIKSPKFESKKDAKHFAAVNDACKVLKDHGYFCWVNRDADTGLWQLTFLAPETE